MKDEERARALAEKLVRVGTGAGKRVVAVLTTMDAPLGVSVGNANETREALAVLHGRGPADLVECTMVLGAEMLLLGGVVANVADGREKLETAVADGSAVRVMERMIEAQGGDPRVVTDPHRLVVAPVTVPIRSPRSGFVAAIDALEIGLSAVALGAGRLRADQAVDHAVGIEIDRGIGEAVTGGDVLARLIVRDAAAAEAVAQRVAAAFVVADERPARKDLVIDRVTS